MSLDGIHVVPVTKTVRLLLDGGLVRDVDDLRRRVNAAKRTEMLGGSLSDTAPQLQAQLEEAETKLDGSAETFTFQAIGRARFVRLVETHPPSSEQWDRYRRHVESTGPLGRPNPPEFDPDPMSVDLVAASCVTPSATSEEWRRFRDEQLSDGQWAELFRAALEVNMEAPTRPFYGTDTEPTPTIGPE